MVDGSNPQPPTTPAIEVGEPLSEEESRQINEGLNKRIETYAENLKQIRDASEKIALLAIGEIVAHGIDLARETPEGFRGTSIIFAIAAGIIATANLIPIAHGEFESRREIIRRQQTHQWWRLFWVRTAGVAVLIALVSFGLAVLYAKHGEQLRPSTESALTERRAGP